MQQQFDLGDRKPAKAVDSEQSATEEAAEGVAEQGAGISGRKLGFILLNCLFGFIFDNFFQFLTKVGKILPPFLKEYFFCNFFF